MSVRERKKNGKIVKSYIRIVLDLLEHEMASFRYSYTRLKEAYNLLDSLHSSKTSENTFVSEMENIELYLQVVRMCGLSLDVSFNYAQDLFEFFYGKDAPEEDEYFYFEFPINRKKFERERIDIDKMRDVLKDKKRDNLELLDLLEHNLGVFYSNLKS